MRILVAPDKFKGTLSARASAEAMRRGVLAASPDAEVTCVPLADGGEGTVAVLTSTGAAEPAEIEAERPEGPFSFPVARMTDGSVCVEVATTSGGVAAPDALRASSVRTGYALRRLRRDEPSQIYVAVGGSSSTDGGTGIAAALGWRFTDGSGTALEPGGGALERLERIEGGPPFPPVTGLCDVANPMLGELGAAPVFAPQKGASPGEVEQLERGLTRLADVVRSTLGIDIGMAPYTGAGGGIGGGLLAFLRAELRNGFGFVAETIGLREAIAGADLVITGEGRLDEGSLAGKVIAGVARLARLDGVPTIAVCGEVDLDEEQIAAIGLRSARAVSPGAGVGAGDALAAETRRALEV